MSCNKSTLHNSNMLLFLLWSYAIMTTTASDFEIPPAKIVAYYPTGVRISVPHTAGMQLLAVHARINAPMRRYEVGEHYCDVWRPTNATWIYTDNAVRLRKGDRLHYWLYVLRDGVGYRKDDQVALIDDVIMTGEADPLEQEWMQKMNVRNSFGVTIKDKPMALQSPCEATWPNMSFSQDNVTKANTPATEDLLSCNLLLANTTLRLLNVRTLQDVAEERVALLVELLAAHKDYKMLTLLSDLARTSTDGPKNIVELVLREKLDLPSTMHVESAERISQDAIRFELKTLEDVLQVFKAAKDKLQNSTRVIIRP